jgi:hypothetical protein
MDVAEDGPAEADGMMRKENIRDSGGLARS